MNNKIRIFYTGVAIAGTFVGPALAEVGQADLKTLRGMRIGASCEEFAAGFAALAAEADKFGTTSKCSSGRGVFHSQALGIKTPHKFEGITLKYTPDGRLWSVNSLTRFSPDVGPLRLDAIESVFTRFGREPLMYSDASQDRLLNEINRSWNNTELIDRAVWTSSVPPWRGSVNTHTAMKPCPLPWTSGPSRKCYFAQHDANSKAWKDRIGQLRGNLMSMQLSTNQITGRTILLSISLYDSSFGEAAKKDESEEMVQGFRASTNIPKY